MPTGDLRNTPISSDRGAAKLSVAKKFIRIYLYSVSGVTVL